MTAFLIAFVFLALILGVFAFVGLPYGTRLRRLAVSSFFAILLAVLFFGYSDMLGRPKSTQLEVLRTTEPEAKVLGSYALDGRGIYLWLQLKGVAEPRYYMLPWDEGMAQQLQEAIASNQEGHGGGVMMRLPFERSWEKREEMFYAAPQPKLPDKGGAPPPMVFQAPEQGA